MVCSRRSDSRRRAALARRARLWRPSMPPHSPRTVPPDRLRRLPDCSGPPAADCAIPAGARFPSAPARMHPEGALRLGCCVAASKESARTEPLQPAAAEPGVAQAGANIKAVAHQPPDQLAAMVLDHHDHNALVEPEVATRYPGAMIGGRKTWIQPAGVA